MQLGNGSASGSILGNVSLNNSFMVFDRSDTYTYGGNISGIAALQQIGSGITTLTGANSYNFGSTITRWHLAARRRRRVRVDHRQCD